MKEVPRSALMVGDIIRVRPGDFVAADGFIVSGSSSLDESLLTGESIPVLRAVGSRVLAGSVNMDGSIDLCVEHLEQASQLGHMSELLNQARQQRPASVELASRVASYFVISAVVLAALVFGVWWWLDGSRAFSATLAVLVVTCPCALSLAIPTALSAATNRLSQLGLLVSQLDVLEQIPKLDMVIFDKTGTLSSGQPVIAQVTCNAGKENSESSENSVSSDDLLELVAALEQHSNHPIARAFAHINTQRFAERLVNVPGQGIQGEIDGVEYRVGTAEFVGHPEAGPEVIHISKGAQLLGSIQVEDAWRDSAEKVVEALSKQKIESVILSGDSQPRVNMALSELGIQQGFGGRLPEQKLADLHQYQQQGRCVLAVGDGVNDTGLLAGADASIALASGAGMAQAGADVVLTGSSLLPIKSLLQVCRNMQRIIRQNLAWAIAYNVVAVPLAATGVLGPGLAALGMSLSSLVVILNAARLASPSMIGELG